MFEVTGAVYIKGPEPVFFTGPTPIQDAIDASSDTDVVLVSPGTYFENINFNGKTIHLSEKVDVDSEKDIQQKPITQIWHPYDIVEVRVLVDGEYVGTPYELSGVSLGNEPLLDRVAGDSDNYWLVFRYEVTGELPKPPQLP
ncbi:MAG: hypothetical protein IH908_09350, partial [Proteobacteria bacterium]|nr:hypothetical protein [Pseudomonadota bacterium]